MSRMTRKSNRPKIMAALEHAPAGLTQIELQRITGASAGTIHRHIHQLHDEGAVHIASWKTETAGSIRGGVYQARYKLGRGMDRPKPPALTPAEIHKRMVARVKAAGELKELRARWAETEKRRYWRNKPVRPDALVAAFYGIGS